MSALNVCRPTRSSIGDTEECDDPAETRNARRRWLGSVAGGLEDVEDGEEEDPDDIYKVPIETDIIERGGAPGR